MKDLNNSYKFKNKVPSVTSVGVFFLQSKSSYILYIIQRLYLKMGEFSPASLSYKNDLFLVKK